MKIKDDKKIALRKKEILDSARSIIEREGIEALSIRKISDMLKQTPGIIYHYFKNKDEILFQIVQEGYADIIGVVQKHALVENPELRLAYVLSDYIYTMSEKATLYSIIMNSKDPLLRKQTEILKEGICDKSEAMKQLSICLKEGVQQHRFHIDNIELQAQVIWCTMYGVLDRCIKEKPQEELMDALVKAYVNMILQSLKGKEYESNHFILQ